MYSVVVSIVQVSLAEFLKIHYLLMIKLAVKDYHSTFLERKKSSSIKFKTQPRIFVGEAENRFKILHN